MPTDTLTRESIIAISRGLIDRGGGIAGAQRSHAFGIGGFAGTVLADVSRLLLGSPVMAYATVFAVEACFFVAMNDTDNSNSDPARVSHAKCL